MAGGSSADFTLTFEVQGANPENIMVVLNNVLQEPTVAYSVVADASGNAKILRFTETPPSGDEIYVVHRNHSQIVSFSTNKFSWFDSTTKCVTNFYT